MLMSEWKMIIAISQKNSVKTKKYTKEIIQAVSTL